MTTVVCCDVCTTQVKAAVVDSAGSVLASARRRVPMVDHPSLGRVQDPELFVTQTSAVLRECTLGVEDILGARRPQPEVLVLTGQQAGLVLVDEDGEAIAPYDSWLDTAYKDVLRSRPDIAERGRANCGSLDFMHLPKLVRQRELLGGSFDRAVAWTVAAPYVAGRLSGSAGRDAFIDVASVSYSGIVDLEALRWDDDLVQALDLPESINPRIVRPQEVVGRLTKAYADETGLPTGLPILAGVGDFPAATLGGLVPEGHVGEILGTASMSFGVTSQFPGDLPGSLRFSRSPVDGLWLAYDLVAGGDLVRWFCEDLLGRPAAPETLAQLGHPERPDELWFVPFGAGAPRYGGPWGWIGLSERMNRSDMYGALLEGLAFEQEWSRQQIAAAEGIESTGESPVHVLGGSGAANALWLQTKARVAGRPFRIYEGPEDPTLVGAAIIGALALGWGSDAWEIARGWPLGGREVVAHPDEVPAAQERFRRYLDLTGR